MIDTNEKLEKLVKLAKQLNSLCASRVSINVHNVANGLNFNDCGFVREQLNEGTDTLSLLTINLTLFVDHVEK